MIYLFNGANIDCSAMLTGPGNNSWYTVHSGGQEQWRRDMVNAYTMTIARGGDRNCTVSFEIMGNGYAHFYGDFITYVRENGGPFHRKEFPLNLDLFNDFESEEKARVEKALASGILVDK